MKNTLLATSALALALSGQIATAQDADWTGFYAGISVASGELTAADTEFDLDRKFGVHAGYSYDLGEFVVGGELEQIYSSYEFGADSTDITYTRAKAIAGYDAGMFMPYVAAGFGGVRGLETNTAPERNDSSAFFAVGAVYEFMPDWRASLEYSAQTIEDYDDLAIDLESSILGLRISRAF